jgi:hypothetical protein
MSDLQARTKCQHTISFFSLLPFRLFPVTLSLLHVAFLSLMPVTLPLFFLPFHLFTSCPSFLLPFHLTPVTMSLLPVAFLSFPSDTVFPSCCISIFFQSHCHSFLLPFHLFPVTVSFHLVALPSFPGNVFLTSLSFLLVAFHGLLTLFFIHVAFPSINNFLTFCRISICLYAFLYSNRSTCQNCPSCRRFTHLTPFNTVHPFELSHVYIAFPVAIPLVDISIFLSPFLL